MDKLYSVNDLAKLIGVCGHTIRGWEDAQLIPQGVRQGRRQKRVWGKTHTLAILAYAKDILNYSIPQRVFDEVETGYKIGYPYRGD